MQPCVRVINDLFILGLYLYPDGVIAIRDMNYQNLTVPELLGLVQTGDAAAFEALYRRMWEPMFVFAVKRLDSEADAEDVVQEVFANLWTRRQSIRVERSPEAYLFSAVRYKVIDRVKELLKSPDKIDYVHESLLPSLNSAWDSLLGKEASLLINEEVRQLPQKMREIYLLSIDQHYSIPEIATTLDLSAQTVRNQLNTARNRLKGSLKHAFLLFLLIKIP